MKLLGSTKDKITKNENGENFPNLEITTEVVLVHCNIFNDNYQQNSRVSSDFYNIPIGTVKKLVPNFFSKENYVLHY